MFQQAPPDTAEVEAGLVHVGRGMPHAFVTAPDSPAQFLAQTTPNGAYLPASDVIAGDGV